MRETLKRWKGLRYSRKNKTAKLIEDYGIPLDKKRINRFKKFMPEIEKLNVDAQLKQDQLTLLLDKTLPGIKHDEIYCDKLMTGLMKKYEKKMVCPIVGSSKPFEGYTKFNVGEGVDCFSQGDALIIRYNTIIKSKTIQNPRDGGGFYFRHEYEPAKREAQKYATKIDNELKINALLASYFISYNLKPPAELGVSNGSSKVLHGFYDEEEGENQVPVIIYKSGEGQPKTIHTKDMQSIHYIDTANYMVLPPYCLKNGFFELPKLQPTHVVKYASAFQTQQNERERRQRLHDEALQRDIVFLQKKLMADVKKIDQFRNDLYAQDALKKSLEETLVKRDAEIEKLKNTPQFDTPVKQEIALKAIKELTDKNVIDAAKIYEMNQKLTELISVGIEIDKFKANQEKYDKLLSDALENFHDSDTSAEHESKKTLYDQTLARKKKKVNDLAAQIVTYIEQIQRGETPNVVSLSE